MRLSDFKPVIFGKLKDIQDDHPELISPKINVCEDFGLARSFWWGATTRAKNARVSEDDIKWISRWTKTDKDGNTPYFQGDMIVRYSDSKMMVPMYVRFSQAL